MKSRLISTFIIYFKFNIIFSKSIKGPSRGPLKRTSRLPRIPFTTHQLSELEKAYKTATYLSTEDANILAKKLDLTGVRVKIWFQNRRARDRREKREIKLSPSLGVNGDDMEDDNEVIVA